ncbi:MAG TPA: FAD-binding oxidoreductase [Deltaproteobacteria bacterium]|nr:FAD-binding oxidoreductase [Deltaproteobacteria bacterium]HPP79633.1 FAD-binding oxidoreductase [Deltaproteobacteria bacterium]
MALKDVLHDIEGYDELEREIEILRKYGPDHVERAEEAARIMAVLHPPRLSLKVSEIIEETPSTKTLRLVSAKGDLLPPFMAGQYVNLFVERDGVRTSRPYSISSSPTQTAYYDITVRAVEDGFVSRLLLEDTRPGDVFESTSPAGTFTHNPLFHGDDLVFLAGGSGITPFMSMIRETADRGLDRKILLVYGSRDPGDIVFKDELERIAARRKNIAVHHVISEPPEGYTGLAGFITADLVKRLAGDVTGKTFYVCGPAAMYERCLAELASLGLPRKRVRTEAYGPPKNVTAQAGWPKHVSADDVFTVKISGGRVLSAKAGEPLMVSLEKAHIQIPAQCRSGECSLCRTKLLSGTVFHPEGARLRKSDRQFGYIHPCVAYPLEDLEILI